MKIHKPTKLKLFLPDPWSKAIPSSLKTVYHRVQSNYKAYLEKNQIFQTKEELQFKTIKILTFTLCPIM